MYCEMNATQFKGMVELLNNMADECRVHTSKDGINIKLVDGANVAMVEVDIPNTSFKKYACDEDKTYGIYLDKLLKVIKKSSKFGNSVQFKLDDSMTFTRGNYQFKTGLIQNLDKIRKEPRIPTLTEEQISNKFIISSNNLFYSLDCMSGEHVHVKQYMGSIDLFTDNNSRSCPEISSVIFGDEITIEMGKDAHSMYNLDYLKPCVKIMKSFCTVLSFEFGSDWPCIVSSDENGMNIKMMLAPRIIDK